jgi:hypothetical protein
MSASQILADLDIIPFNKDTKVVPQIAKMTENVYYGRFIMLCNDYFTNMSISTRLSLYELCK